MVSQRNFATEFKPKILGSYGGPGYFFGGLDIKRIPTLSPAEVNALTVAFARPMLCVSSLPMPTIAGCSGHAVAGGGSSLGISAVLLLTQMDNFDILTSSLFYP